MEEERLEVEVITSKDLHESAGKYFDRILGGEVFVISRYGRPCFQLGPISKEVLDILTSMVETGPTSVETQGNGNKS